MRKEASQPLIFLCPKGGTFHPLHVTNRHGNGLRSVQALLAWILSMLGGMTPFCSKGTLKDRNRPRQYSSSEWVTEERHIFQLRLNSHLLTSLRKLFVAAFSTFGLSQDSSDSSKVCLYIKTLVFVRFCLHLPLAVLCIFLQAKKSQAFFEKTS